MRALPRRAPAGNGLCDPGRAGSYCALTPTTTRPSHRRTMGSLRQPRPSGLSRATRRCRGARPSKRRRSPSGLRNRTLMQRVTPMSGPGGLPFAGRDSKTVTVTDRARSRTTTFLGGKIPDCTLIRSVRPSRVTSAPCHLIGRSRCCVASRREPP